MKKSHSSLVALFYSPAQVQCCTLPPGTASQGSAAPTTTLGGWGPTPPCGIH